MALVWDLSTRSQKDEYYFYHMGKAIDTYHQIYDKFLLTISVLKKQNHVCHNSYLSMMLITL